MNLMDKVDNLILGGGMTYTFKAALGGHVGSSICEADKLDLALDIMRIAKEKGVNLVLSNQAVVADAFNNDANYIRFVTDEYSRWLGRVGYWSGNP